MHQFFIGFVGFPLSSFRILWDEYVFDELVQFVQIQISKNRADNGALWGATVGLIPSPIFQISCLEEVADEAEKLFVFNGFS